MLTTWFDPVKMFLSEHFLVAIAIVLFIEEVGVPLFVPGDLFIVMGGLEVSRGTLSLPVLLLVEEIVTLIGGTILFYVSRGIGRPALMRYGHLIGLDHARVTYAEEYLHRYQFRAVFLGRLTPGLRIVIVVAAGLANLEMRRFLPALALGSFVYLLAYTMLGMIAGEAAIQFVDRLAIPASAIVSVVALGLLVIGIRRAGAWRMTRTPLRPSVLSAGGAGIVAAVTALLASDVARGVVVVAGRLAGQEPAARTSDAGRLIAPLLSWPGFLVIALLIALLAPVLGVKRRTLPMRLVITALVPFFVTMVIVNPLIAGRGFGWSTVISMTSVVVIGVRWAIFAAMLEYLDEMMYGERPRPAAATLAESV